jgi:hypothetical protein
MQGTADATSPLTEALLPLLLHSVVPAVVAMLQQGSSARAVAAGTVAADQQQQQLLAELRPLLGSLVVQVALAGALIPGWKFNHLVESRFRCSCEWCAVHSQRFFCQWLQGAVSHDRCQMICLPASLEWDLRAYAL